MNRRWAVMPSLARVVPLLFLGLLSGAIVTAAGYKGIRVGGNVSDLPKNFVQDKNYSEGEYQGSWFRISMLDGKVLSVDVIYSGKSLDGTSSRIRFHWARLSNTIAFSHYYFPRPSDMRQMRKAFGMGSWISQI
jgi:hypothetical protein